MDTAVLAGSTPAAHSDALKIFISYSRVDLARADALATALIARGFAVRIDVRDLPYGEEWQAELAGFIAEADTVVWLVSPDSVTSRWCNWELGEVVRLSKRLVPVRVRDIDPDTLPEQLGKINLLPNRGTYDPALHEDALAAALNTNRGWLKQGTRLADAARGWIAAKRESARLLRGRALAEAEEWSVSTPRDTPPPPAEVLELILASRRGQQWRRRIGTGIALTVAAVAVGLIWFGQTQARNAEEQQRVANAAAAQRRNEVARKLLESESQVGSALSTLSAATAADAPSIQRVQSAWLERLTPIRDLLATPDGMGLWLVAGKQVLATADRLMTYGGGTIIAYAAVSPGEHVILDNVGRLLVLDADAAITHAYQWNGDAPVRTYGEPLITFPQGATGGLSSLEFHSVGDRAILGIGRIEATFAGGAEPRGLYLDLASGFGAMMPLPSDPVVEAEAGQTGCGFRTPAGAAAIAALKALGGGRAAFQTVVEPDGTEAICLLARYDASGERVAMTSRETDFASAAGRMLSLPVLKSETAVWKPSSDPQIEVQSQDFAKDVLPLEGELDVALLPESAFYERAMFRGGENSGAGYTRMVLEQVRFEGGQSWGLPPSLRVYERNGGFVVAGLYFDKWTKPEVCWFDAGFVVETCANLGDIYDTGGGMFLSRDGAHVVVAGMETMGSHSLSVVDIDGKSIRVPAQRSGGTVLEAYLDGAQRRLFAVDEGGVVWTYSFPEMELISTFDLNWPEGTNGVLRIGRNYVDLSSQGVARLLDVGTEAPAWIAAPFEQGIAIAGVSVSLDQSVVMLTAADGRIRLLDTVTGMPLTSAFDAGGRCWSVAVDAARSLIELACDTGYLDRTLGAAGGPTVASLSGYTLDGPAAAAAFFGEIRDLELGQWAHATPDEALPPIEGTVEEFLDANKGPDANKGGGSEEPQPQ